MQRSEGHFEVAHKDDLKNAEHASQEAKNLKVQSGIDLAKANMMNKMAANMTAANDPKEAAIFTQDALHDKQVAEEEKHKAASLAEQSHKDRTEATVAAHQTKELGNAVTTLQHGGAGTHINATDTAALNASIKHSTHNTQVDTARLHHDQQQLKDYKQGLSSGTIDATNAHQQIAEMNRDIKKTETRIGYDKSQHSELENAEKLAGTHVNPGGVVHVSHNGHDGHEGGQHNAGNGNSGEVKSSTESGLLQDPTKGHVQTVSGVKDIPIPGGTATVSSGTEVFHPTEGVTDYKTLGTSGNPPEYRVATSKAGAEALVKDAKLASSMAAKAHNKAHELAGITNPTQAQKRELADDRKVAYGESIAARRDMAGATAWDQYHPKEMVTVPNVNPPKPHIGIDTGGGTAASTDTTDNTASTGTVASTDSTDTTDNTASTGTVASTDTTDTTDNTASTGTAASTDTTDNTTQPATGGTTTTSYGGFPAPTYGGFPAPTYGGFPPSGGAAPAPPTPTKPLIPGADNVQADMFHAQAREAGGNVVGAENNLAKWQAATQAAAKEGNWQLTAQDETKVQQVAANAQVYHQEQAFWNEQASKLSAGLPTSSTYPPGMQTAVKDVGAPSYPDGATPLPTGGVAAAPSADPATKTPIGNGQPGDKGQKHPNKV